MSMAADMSFTEEEMTVDSGLGYPRAYAKLCKDPTFSPYINGPPFTFTPYALHNHEAARAKDLDEMFPIIDPKARPTTKPKFFSSLLWKQLNHLGNAGFDPATFRVDPYGNVLYYYADSASPLAWDIDHWFPCSRGGLTVPSNLRILQWQVCKKKHNKLEFLMPWWDFQHGISISQFLSIFASSNSDFRHRAFSLLFLDGESEELNNSQAVDSHVFPQHFIELKKQIGLAPAAVVLSRRESFDSSPPTLKSLDINTRLRSGSPILAARKVKPSMYKENENPEMVTNPYQAIVMARDSFRQRDETAKMQGEIVKLDDELHELKQKTEEEKVTIEDLELVLIKKRRRAEKCRKLAEAQSTYRAMLEKMIRDAMHQSVIYKQQMRLNEAAASALMARLEAQKAICDSSERELHRKFRQRDELETQIRPDWDQARKRSRMADNLFEQQFDNDNNDNNVILRIKGKEPTKTEEKTVLPLPAIEEKPRATPHKELRVFLEEEHKASEAGFSPNEWQERERIEEAIEADDDELIQEKLRKLEIASMEKLYNIPVPATHKPKKDDEDEEDEERINQRGKGNIDKWLQMLLHEDTRENDQNLGNTDMIFQENEIKDLKDEESEALFVKNPPPYKLPSVNETESSIRFGEGKEKGRNNSLARSESSRSFKQTPSSPSIILGMRKGVDYCIRKKPLVIGDESDHDHDHARTPNNSIKSVKKAVNI